ncbi:hypothetical protein FAES_1197 [Fibrella aestuarina BUZ 2]|uniref:Uncharacterized protein n=1 Tax=Fibrella aestuarina BUZ 2 TaxID=1166018 RepID=I0K504_9BACT|nr:hypothetical protein FAES_1197 [Fibrella aestuarina BUZ 2]
MATKWTAFWHRVVATKSTSTITLMGIALLLLLSALLCFAVFYKAIEWFERI